jgi:hypothetical protein
MLRVDEKRQGFGPAFFPLDISKKSSSFTNISLILPLSINEFRK